MKNYIQLLKRHGVLGRTLIFLFMIALLNVVETLEIKVFTATLNDIMNEKMWICMFLVGLFIVVESKVAYRYMIDISEDFKIRHKRALFDKVIYYNINQLGESSMPKIISCLDMANSIGDSLIRELPDWILYIVISAMTSLVILARENLVLLIVVIIEIVPIGVVILIGKRKSKVLTKERKKIDIKTYSIIERLYGYIVVKSFSKEKYECKQFNDVCNEYRDVSIRKRCINNKVETISRFVQFLMNITWIVYGVYSYKNGTFNIPEIMLFSKLTGNLINPFYGANDIFNEINEMNTHMELANEILNAGEEYDGTVTLDNFESSIEFRDVSFKYESSNEVLKNVSFKIPKGSKVGIYGESGAGKSSLVNLMMRFYQCESGNIYIDGIDINEFTNSSLRKHIGIINQEIFLFTNMNIRDNIRYGNENCTDADIIEAAKKANCHNFIMKLPNGYDSFIGNNGVKLSGGERQRIAIARLFLLNPDILIMDEATSKLDNVSEAYVQDAIRKLSKDKTVISIAHRLSTIKDSDILIGIKDHTIYEIGPKEEIDKEGTMFYKLKHTAL